MAAIRKLSQEIIGRIAAGEVVERPASVVKEMVENAIDAGATHITVEVRGGGVEYLRITDDGKGIPAEEIRMAFERHATSKLQTAEQLFDIHTLGFRGEALASVAAVAKVTCTTKTADAPLGIRAKIEGGEFVDIRQAASPVGTTFVVEDLFYNTPVRRKFLKKPAMEASQVSDYILRLMLSHPEIAFRFVNQGKTVYQTIGDGKVESVLYRVYGKEAFAQMHHVSGNMNGLILDGYVGVGELSRGNRQQQSFFINGRYFRSGLMSRAVESGCEGRVMIGRFPMCALFLQLPYQNVDVNVHPNKLEVRFQNEAAIAQAVKTLVSEALHGQSLGAQLASGSGSPAQAAPVEEKVTGSGFTVIELGGGNTDAPEPVQNEAQPEEQTEAQPEAAPVQHESPAASYPPTAPAVQEASRKTGGQASAASAAIERGEAVSKRVSGDANTAAPAPKAAPALQPEEQPGFKPTFVQPAPVIKPEQPAAAKPASDETRGLYTDFVPDFSALGGLGSVMHESSSPEVSRIMREMARKQEQNRAGERLTDSRAEKAQPADAHPATEPETAAQPVQKPAQAPAAAQPLQQEQTTLLGETDSAAQLRLIGIAFSTYWIFECGDKLLLVDQHAAHERMLYDQMMQQFEGKTVSQQLLAPVLVRMTQHELMLLEELQEVLGDAGFDVQPFDETSAAIHAIPTLFGQNEDPKALFLEAMDEWQAGRGAVTRERMRRQVAQMACKRAIKAGDKLSEDEVKGFLAAMLQSNSMPTCPHGRPIVVEMTQYALEKRFKRIQ
ncbi:MAG: DNA mismatch repair endonuclease MutL [Clostridia bacterium]|nr:DNA mismatch repair endonuclease MutL [Clostridia bacterium]